MVYKRRPSRQLFVLIKQKDGFWQEIAALPLAAISGRSGAEPYEAVFLGEGYLMSCREIYIFQDGKRMVREEMLYVDTRRQISSGIQRRRNREAVEKSGYEMEKKGVSLDR